MGRKSCRERSLGESAIRADLPDVRIREDLERRGVPADFSGSISTRLVEIAGDLSAAEYEAVLEGVAAAYGVHRERENRSARAESREIHRLVQDFAVELKKLDEGLRILSAYLVRMRERSRRRSSGLVLH
jgi:hypothetical protein